MEFATPELAAKWAAEYAQANRRGRRAMNAASALATRLELFLDVGGTMDEALFEKDHPSVGWGKLSSTQQELARHVLVEYWRHGQRYAKWIGRSV